VKRLRSYSGEEINLLKLFAQMLVNLTLRANQESELNSKNEEIARINKFLETALVKETELGHLKTRFITTTSHQFRTPLTTIRTSTELLDFIAGSLDSVPAEKLRRNISRIYKEVERLTLLMNDVLFFGKADAEHIQFRPVETDCVALIKDLAETHEFVSGDLRKPVVELKGKERLLNIDAGLFSQMISNLLSNALKFSEGKPAPVIRINFTPDSLELEVEDYGVGIPSEDLKNLFNSFFRGSNVENIIGTGLGLAIVKHITELHNGSVSARSVLNQGSVFTIRIPC
jgi:signal transduction histidine kinase